MNHNFLERLSDALCLACFDVITHGAAGGVNEVENGLDGGGLAGAVPADQPHDHALVDLEGDIVKGEFGIFLPQTLRINPCP